MIIGLAVRITGLILVFAGYSGKYLRKESVITVFFTLFILDVFLRSRSLEYGVLVVCTP